MSKIEIIMILLAGLNILVGLVLGGILLSEIKPVRRIFGSKNKIILIDSINKYQSKHYLKNKA